jgi:hypothetical protein
LKIKKKKFHDDDAESSVVSPMKKKKKKKRVEIAEPVRTPGKKKRGRPAKDKSEVSAKRLIVTPSANVAFTFGAKPKYTPADKELSVSKQNAHHKKLAKSHEKMAGKAEKLSLQHAAVATRHADAVKD